MNVKIFFDGQNFYRSLLRYDDSLRVDYDRLAVWITQAVAGVAGVFCGAYYYVGVSADAPPLVEGFLKGLELRPGYYVRREPRVRRAGRCPSCGADYEYTTEKRVDTRLVAELIQYAANGSFDAAVLVSGDDDFVPAVEAVNALGKRVWVATWSAEELSSDLRVRCFGQIRLSEGIPAFRVERPRIAERERYGVAPRLDGRMPLRPMRSPQEPTLERGLAELQRAQARLPHVSRGYFVTRWRSHQLPPAGQEREVLVQQLIDAGLAEEFEVTDGEGRVIRAIRTRNPAVA
jgi:NYN domain-containing protein